jgi:hypothetical protein
MRSGISERSFRGSTRTTVITGIWALTSSPSVVERLLRDELTLVQLGRPLEGLPGLRQFGGRPPHVGRVFDLRQVVDVGGAVLRERAGVRGALLVQAVLQFLAIDLDERLPRGDTIAQIGEHATNDAVDSTTNMRNLQHMTLIRARGSFAAPSFSSACGDFAMDRDMLIAYYT